jgi:hypothetical protein
VPHEVGDSLHDADRLLERFGVGGRHVTVVGEHADAEEPFAAQHFPQRRTVLREALEAYGSLLTIGRLRPPRTAVVGEVGGQRAVHLGVDLCHLIVSKPTAEVQEPRLHEELGDVDVVVLGSEAAPDVERTAVAIPERDGTRGVRRARIEERPQDHPPVKEIVQPTARHPQFGRGHQLVGVRRSLTRSANS